VVLIRAISAVRWVRSIAGVMQWFLKSLLIGFIFLSWPVLVNAGPAPYQARIENIASATFTNGAGEKYTIESNLVVAVVARVPGVLLQTSQIIYAVRGSVVAYPHTITNTGNAPDVFELKTLFSAGGDFSYNSLKIYPDNNLDGSPDTRLPITVTPVLAPGQRMNVVVLAEIPSIASAGAAAKFTVSAQGSAAYAAQQKFSPAPLVNNIDQTIIVAGAFITANKHLDIISGPSPNSNDGNHLTFVIEYQNIGATAAVDVEITDRLGLAGGDFDTRGFAYVPGSARWNGLALTDIQGSDPPGIDYEFGVSQSNRLKAIIRNVSPRTQGRLEFKVDVVSGLESGSSMTTNLAQVRYYDEGQPRQFTTNLAIYKVETTRVNRPDLTITKKALGRNTINSCSIFSVKVENQADVETEGEIRVTDFLPTGLVYEPNCAVADQILTSGGQSWVCQGASGSSSVTCASSAPVPARQNSQAGQHPYPLQIVVRSVKDQLPSQPTLGSPVRLLNHAHVSGGGEPTSLSYNNDTSAPIDIGAGATVRGTVWLDRNHDRRYAISEGDMPLANWKVEALVRGEVVGTGYTAEDGTYAITNLVPGSYQIRFRDPVSNIVNGRPVCNQEGLSSTVATNCKKTSEGQVPSKLDDQGITLEVVLQEGDVILEQSLPLDPSGVIYDSLTRKPIAGATVKLSAPSGFSSAIHLIGGPTALEQVTGPAGYYQFLLTAEGVKFCAAQSGGACEFSLSMNPPTGYLSPPSTLIPPSLTVGACSLKNCLDPTGKPVFGSIYSVNSANISDAPQLGQPVEYFFALRLTDKSPDIVNNHIPLDPPGVNASELLLKKLADKTMVELGDSVGYEITLKNPTGNAMLGTVIEDTLPTGFVYVPGSARLAGVPLADPPTRGPKLNFALGQVAANSSAVLTYRTLAGVNALQGNGINTAIAKSGTTKSNNAQAKVTVSGGVFSDAAILVGKVFLDCNKDGRQGQPDEQGVRPNHESGVAGVRLFLDNGSYAITDEEGKYSIYGLAPRTYALKLDLTTLPLGAVLHSSDNRNLGDGSLRFVDPKKGELVRGDFSLISCEPEVVEQVTKRRESVLALSSGIAESHRQLQQDFSFDPVSTQVTNTKDRPATGVVTQSNIGLGASLPPLPVSTAPSELKSAAHDAEPAPPSARQRYQAKSKDFDKWLPDTDATLAFANVDDGDVLPDSQLTLQVKGRLGASLVVLVNGKPVGEEKIGKRSTLEDKKIQALEFVSVSLNPGRNELALLEKDPFGNERGRVVVAVRVPGELAQLRWDVPSEAKSDVADFLTVRLNLLDKAGLPVNARLPITLDVKNTSWQESDLDPIEPGLQVFVQDGVGSFKLKPPLHAGDVRITAMNGEIKSEATVKFLPNLRPMIAAGVVEGALAMRKFDPAQIQSDTKPYSFEKEITHWATEIDHGRYQAGVRSSLFLKGAVKGEYLLTLAYDSDKDLSARMFRDISPEEYYPVYGDSSERGWDAQSTQHLYVRVDKNKSWFLYGDYQTKDQDTGGDTARQLASTSRTVTGAKWHYEDDKLRVNAYASQDTLRQYVVELRAQGISGPYDLLGSGAIVNGETVEIITRDRNALGQIVSTELLQRFSDYEIEPFNRRILFKAPVASVDANSNPRYIRVRYEVDQGGEPFWLTGLDAQAEVADKVFVSASMQKDRNPSQPYDVAGVAVQAKVGEFANLTGELATTDHHGVASTSNAKITGVGYAARVALKYDDGKNQQAGLSIAKSDATFDNASASLAAGRTEVKGTARTKESDGLILLADLTHTDDDLQGNKRSQLTLRAENELSPKSKLTVSMSGIHESVTNGTAVAQDHVMTVGARLQSSLDNFPGASVYVEGEQAVNDSSRQLLAVGGDYKLASKAKIYAKYELTSSLVRLNNPLADSKQVSLVGVEQPFSAEGRAFSEYRVRDGSDGQQAEAALGVRQTFKLTDHWRASGSFEKVKPVTASNSSAASTAVTAGFEYLNDKDFKYTGRIERRDASSGDSWLLQQGVALKHTADLTSLARLYWNQQTNASAQDVQRWRVLVGLAHRDVAVDDLNWLARVERRYEDDPTASTPYAKQSWITGLHLNRRLRGANTLSQHWAYKSTKESYAGDLNSSSHIGLMFLRYTHSFTTRWDGDIHGGVMLRDRWGNRQTGVGTELGYMLNENLWFSLGYNRFGFHDVDLTGADHTQRGWYIRMRWKFDENLFTDQKSLPGGRAP
jgi:uncharacterized repeat protein (TIGR01451 family)